MNTSQKTKLGRLILMPNTLDFGIDSPATELPELQAALPLHAIEVASQLRHWVAENAKTTRAFLKRVGLVRPLSHALQDVQIAELPRPSKGSAKAHADSPSAAEKLLAPSLAGHDIGLISEAGLPAVADPGAVVVQAAHRLGLEVLTLAGPSSLLLALASSGLNGQSFAFVGYLPVKSDERSNRLRELEARSRREQQTQIVIETPYRNPALLEGLLSTLQAQTRLSVSCGLTLPGGFTRSQSVAQWRLNPSPELPTHVPAVFCFLAA